MDIGNLPDPGPIVTTVLLAGQLLLSWQRQRQMFRLLRRWVEAAERSPRPTPPTDPLIVLLVVRELEGPAGGLPEPPAEPEPVDDEAA